MLIDQYLAVNVRFAECREPTRLKKLIELYADIEIICVSQTNTITNGCHFEATPRNSRGHFLMT